MMDPSLQKGRDVRGAKDLDGSSQCLSFEISEGECNVRRGAWENAPAFITDLSFCELMW